LPNVLLIPGTTSLKTPKRKHLLSRIHSAYVEVEN